MTRIWIEFDDLDALKEKLMVIEDFQLTAYRQELLATIGFYRDKGDAAIVEAIRKDCLKSFDQDNLLKPIGRGSIWRPFINADEDDRKQAESWANQVIEA